MAYNVFGVPITDETLKGMEKYESKHPLTRLDRAREALAAAHDGVKDHNALNYVENLKSQYGDGVSTLCLFYNATGDPVKYQFYHDYEGYLWKSPVPDEIGNGQWGAFLHVKPDWPNIDLKGSSGSLTYRGMNDAGRTCDWVCSWYNPWRRPAFDDRCKAYAMIKTDENWTWNELHRLTQGGSLQWTGEGEGCVARVSMGDNTTSNYQAILTLAGADQSYP